MHTGPSGFAPDEFPAARPLEDSSAAAACSCTSEALSLPAGGEILVLRVGGEVDLLSLPTLEAALDARLDQRPRHLLVDLARMVFCSVRGLATLVQADTTATERGIGYAISGTPPWLDRVWDTCWDADQLPTRYTDLAAAVTALRAHDAT